MQASDFGAPNSAPADLSLRERNRIDTWRTIHNAAAELALESGWTPTTVEKIAARAGISNRTFFNYFASKEDAILGAREPYVSEEALLAFQASDRDLIHRTVSLIAAIRRSGYPYPDLRERRLRIFQEVPELGARTKHLATSVEHLAQPIIAEEAIRLARARPDGPPIEPDVAARVLTLHGAAIIRFAFERDPAGISELSEASIASAIDTFGKVVHNSTWPN